MLVLKIAPPESGENAAFPSESAIGIISIRASPQHNITL
jgi:hypothetical protein